VAWDWAAEWDAAEVEGLGWAAARGWGSAEAAGQGSAVAAGWEKAAGADSVLAAVGWAAAVQVAPGSGWEAVEA
jgi:hypothetical protein